MVNHKAISILKEQTGNSGSNGDVPESLQGLLHEFRRPVQDLPPERTGPVQPMFLGLLPTRACNLSCVYCDFGASESPGEQMNFQMAATAVDWMAENVQPLGQDTLDVHFFGGEPFFAGEVVDVAVHRARAVADWLGLVPRFEVATNGVFDEKRAQFVGDYFDTVVLSFDGTQEIHDRHRGSFETVKRTAELLSQSPTELCFRVCVSQESVAQLEQIVQWFCEAFRPSMINVETLQPTPESEAAGLRPPDPYVFAIHYVRASQIVENFGITAVYVSASTEAPRHSFCPVGKDTLIVSPDGRVSSCYLPQREWQKRGLDLDVGWLSTDGTMQIDFETLNRLRRMVMEKPRCKRCFCRWTCAGGCHVNHSYPGCSLEYNDFCIQTRIITACSLLKELGFDRIADTLLEDRAAMQVLASQESDCLDEQLQHVTITN